MTNANQSPDGKSGNSNKIVNIKMANQHTRSNSNRNVNTSFTKPSKRPTSRNSRNRKTDQSLNRSREVKRNSILNN